jgi:hypothetical protein
MHYISKWSNIFKFKYVFSISHEVFLLINKDVNKSGHTIYNPCGTLRIGLVQMDKNVPFYIISQPIPESDHSSFLLTLPNAMCTLFSSSFQCYYVYLDSVFHSYLWPWKYSCFHNHSLCITVWQSVQRIT